MEINNFQNPKSKGLRQHEKLSLMYLLTTYLKREKMRTIPYSIIGCNVMYRVVCS